MRLVELEKNIKALIGISKVKGKGVHLCCPHSFLFFQVSQMNSFAIVQEKKMTARILDLHNVKL